MNNSELSVAVLLPCFNEETTVGKVVSDFKKVPSQATIYVFDNASTDRTAQIAEDAGATVIFSKNPGKGNVVRHLFAEVDADYYVMADGDSTYPAEYGLFPMLNSGSRMWTMFSLHDFWSRLREKER